MPRVKNLSTRPGRVSAMAQPPKPNAQSLAPKAKSPKPRAQGPKPNAQSLTPKAKSPRPRAQSREPKAQGPEPRAQIIGLIGLGIMGSAISASLFRAGYEVVGYDVVAARRREHVRAGGRVARSVSDTGGRADVLICSLPSSAALLTVASELAGHARAGMIVIETSTLPIQVKLEARQRLAAAGAILLDCPLSGTGAQARVGDVVVYASGPRKAYRAIAPVLEAFARAHHHVGAFGAGSKTKFVANLLVGIHNVAAAEALVLTMKAGLDPAKTLKIVADGAGGSRMLQVRGPLMVKGDYSEPMNRLSLWAKDVAVIADFARELNCPTPLFSATTSLYAAASAMGRGEEDTAAVCAVLESMANHCRETGSTRRRARR